MHLVRTVHLLLTERQLGLQLGGGDRRVDGVHAERRADRATKTERTAAAAAKP